MLFWFLLSFQNIWTYQSLLKMKVKPLLCISTILCPQTCRAHGLNIPRILAPGNRGMWVIIYILQPLYSHCLCDMRLGGPLDQSELEEEKVPPHDRNWNLLIQSSDYIDWRTSSSLLQHMYLPRIQIQRLKPDDTKPVIGLQTTYNRVLVSTLFF